MSLANYADAWISEITVYKKTLTGNKTAIKYVKKFFGDTDIRTIRYRDIIQSQKWLKLSVKGQYNIISTFRTLLRYAWRSEDIQNVPPFPKLSYQLPEIEYLEF